ncbi:hypothetical protein PTI98_007876 [Pleurotus ostreatus]|nr:hypothetical protein PTI98_007876 [Pleurotus ostreatus]
MMRPKSKHWAVSLGLTVATYYTSPGGVSVQTFRRSGTPLPGSMALLTLSLTLRKEESGSNLVGLLAGIVKAFPSDCLLAPEDEKPPVFFSDLPDEVLLLIVHRMDNTTIGRFAQVCRKAWRRDLVVSTYKPPQISSLTELVPFIERHGHDYRRVYIEQPRDRQPGLTLSENHWVNICSAHLFELPQL